MVIFLAILIFGIGIGLDRGLVMYNSKESTDNEKWGGLGLIIVCIIAFLGLMYAIGKVSNRPGRNTCANLYGRPMY
jgi:hypothetical protein